MPSLPDPRRLLPEDALSRQLVVRSVLSAFGTGAFLTGSAFYFTRIVGLSAQQVGLGLTIGGVVAFLLGVPLGKVVDRRGPRGVWLVSAAATAAVFASWPLVGSFAAFLVLTVVGEVVDAVARSARGAYLLEAFPQGGRVRSMAFVRAARNVGYTLGALVGGLALATPTDTAMRALPIVTAGILLLDAVLILRLPVVRSPASDPRTDEDDLAAIHPVESTPRSALRNLGYLATSICGGVLGTHQVLLNIVIPLWLVQATDAPRVLLAWLFGTNTVLAVFGQVPASRGADTVRGALRASRIGAAFFIASCAIVAVTHETVGWVTIALIWVGHVTVTGSELFDSAGMWGFQAELSEPDRRGEYQGVSQVGYAIGTLWAPAAYTWLALTWHTTGWVVIAGIVLVAAVALTPAVAAAERYLTRTRAPEVLPGTR